MKLLCVQVIKDILGTEIDVSATTLYTITTIVLYSIRKLLNLQQMPNMVSDVSDDIMMDHMILPQRSQT